MLSARKTCAVSSGIRPRGIICAISRVIGRAISTNSLAGHGERSRCLTVAPYPSRVSEEWVVKYKRAPASGSYLLYGMRVHRGVGCNSLKLLVAGPRLELGTYGL